MLATTAWVGSLLVRSALPVHTVHRERLPLCPVLLELILQMAQLFALVHQRDTTLVPPDLLV